ncbi:hypothetical protein [Dyella sp. AD56]|nr:hypothetical protein [Dyella sp. AD56]
MNTSWRTSVTGPLHWTEFQPGETRGFTVWLPGDGLRMLAALSSRKDS